MFFVFFTMGVHGQCIQCHILEAFISGICSGNILDVQVSQKLTTTKCEQGLTQQLVNCLVYKCSGIICYVSLAILVYYTLLFIAKESLNQSGNSCWQCQFVEGDQSGKANFVYKTYFFFPPSCDYWHISIREFYRCLISENSVIIIIVQFVYIKTST